jgi:hypothetical protein
MAFGLLALLLTGLRSVAPAAAEEANRLVAARESIALGQLRRHVLHLADDTFEGREAGSRGGLAAGVYLGREFQRLGLAGGGVNQSYYQPFDAASRNLLGIWEGSDPLLKQEIVLIGAHYDHVGYGSPTNSFGPLGRIHNGADDNASGTAALLELAEAMVMLEPRPKRTLLFVLWDGEEKGLLGSKYWASNPTVPLSRVRMAINMDMVGRLRNNELEVGGSRTARGLRQLVAKHNRQTDLSIDFTWEMKDNSDHYTFFSRRIPILMPFTGLHDDYHRPSDDSDKVNCEGMQLVTRLMFDLVYDVAEMPRLPVFRTASEQETPAMRKSLEQPLPPLPGRLGVSWKSSEDASRGVRLTAVTAGSPAERAGIRVGDRIVRFGNRDVTDGELLKSWVLLAGEVVQITLERGGEPQPIVREVALNGKPVRLGFSWRVDDAEPGNLIVTRTVTGSPAAVAGLLPNDRVFAVGGESFADGVEFLERAAVLRSPIELTMERNGQTRPVVLEIAGEGE